jgi:glycosyltransferase involved in cell wall biosynthesis
VTGLVSVVIPCHNYGRFLGAAIESVLAQGDESIELIVVDDGSTDDTAEVAARYPDVVYVRQPNLGQAAAQNRGLEAANGEFVLFLDADDESTPGAVEALAGSLRARPDCAFAYGHIDRVDSEGAVLTASPSRSARSQTCLEEDPYAYMLRTNNCLRGGGAVLYRTDLLRRAGGFSLGLGNAQDLDLNLRLAREHPICCVDRVVLRYRFHGGNSTTKFASMLRGMTDAQRGQRDFVQRHPEYRRDYRAGLKRAQSYWGSRLARGALAEVGSGELRTAAGDLATLVRYAPRAGAVELGKIILRRR